MKSSRLKITLISLLATVCAALCCVGLFLRGDSKAALAEEATITTTELRDTYYVGAEVTLPTSVTVTYQSNDYTGSNGCLQTPNGTVYSGDSHVLDEIGEYNVLYEFTVGSSKLQASKTLRVIQTTWEVSSESSTVTYGALTMTQSQYEEGLTVSLADGDTFYYNKPFDLSSQRLTEVINYQPWYWENPMATNLIVTLTDCYDPTISLQMVSSYDPGIYLKAGASNQRLVGLLPQEVSTIHSEYAKTRKYVTVDGKSHLAYYDDRYGRSAGTRDYTIGGLTWKYDYDAMRVYTAVNTPENVLFVNDLTHEEIYPDEANRFKGFTTGEVYLSITCSNYNASKATFEIGALFGESGEALLSADYSDTKAPVIKVDAELTNQDGVYAAKGEAFTVFDAVAYDVNLVDLKTAVYYNYGSDKPFTVTLTDGKFTPTRLGNYTIVYTATDRFGNTTSETVSVNVIDSLNGKSVTKGIEFTLSEDLEGKTYPAGIEAALPTYTTVGINGEVKIKITALSQFGNEISIDAKTNTFIPRDVGTYTIRYQYSDNVNTYEKQYTVTCTASEELSFLDKPVLPTYFIKNATYTLEKFYVYAYQSGEPTPVEAAMQVSFDGGAYVDADYENFKVTGESSVQFRFYKNEVEYYTSTFEIVNVGFGNNRLSIYEYFQGDFTVLSQSDNSMYISNVKEGNNSLEFINALSASSFVLEFKVPQTAKYNAVNVILTDYYNREKKTVLTYKASGDRLYVSVDGGVQTLVSGGKFADGTSKRIAYNASNNVFSFNNLAEINYALPFKTELCLLEIELVGLSVTANDEETAAGISVGMVNNQVFSVLARDAGQPIVTAESSGGYKSLNDEIVLHIGSYLDVFCPTLRSSLKVQVELPTGGYATATDGTKLDGIENDCDKEYVLKLSSYGAYRVVYTATDAYNNVGQYTYSVIVQNEIAPTISFADGANEYTVVTVQRGVAFTLKDYVCSDDYTETEDLVVTYTVIGDDTYGVVGWTKELTIVEKGMYTAYYYCVDGDGNVSTISYKIRVE